MATLASVMMRGVRQMGYELKESAVRRETRATVQATASGGS